MFLDEIEIEVKGGDGGDGAVSFHREKYKPRGGPDGGDGGDGGDVILKVDPGLTTLNHLRYENSYAAGDGKNGQESNKKGKSGEDRVIKVAPGTIIYDQKGKKLADLTEEGETFTTARGGEGGRGNARFKSSSRQAPRFAEQGEKGEVRQIKLELKLLADVGLVGFPNVGKSTLISHISAAKPKIDSYHFTTLSPNLGVVGYGDYDSYVVADIPGLIEGAHRGEGLGDRFLKHLERTKLLVHMLDASGLEGRDPRQDFEIINEELKSFSPELADLTQLVALNKIDLTAGRENTAKLMQYFQELDYEVYPISAATGEGVEVLKKDIGKKVKELRDEPAPADKKERREEEEEVVITPDQDQGQRRDDITVSRVAPDRFEVSGTLVERLVERTDLNSEAAMSRMLTILRQEGLHEKLERAGVQEGMTVIIGDMEFDYIE